MLLAGGAAVAAPLLSGVTPSPALALARSNPSPPPTDPIEVAQDEAFWAEITSEYDTPTDFLNLENGYWGFMSRPVLDRFKAHTERVNREGSQYARRSYKDDIAPVYARLAASLGVADDELVLTRGATEALQALILGYRGLKPGDAVMFADLDYHSIMATMASLAAREECDVVRLTIPEPVDRDGLIAFYRQALDENPKVRFLLLTHISHRTGLFVPIKEITELARARGVDVVVDAAHSWGQMDFKIADLGADFIGFNLHKWIGAPLGAGLMYLKRDRLDDIAPNPSAGDWEKDRISGRVHTGTLNFAAHLTIGDALGYHFDRIGAANKEARVRYLRNVWVDAARDIDNLEILTRDGPQNHAAITSFRFKGVTSVEGNIALVERLLEEDKIFTVHRDGVTNGACVRVTPSVFNRPNDCLALAAALRRIAATL